MTKEQIESLNLGISPIDTKAEIVINSAVEWLADNTTIDTTKPEKFPNCVKLFLIKYYDLQSLNVGVTSEKIEGLSQSFKNGERPDLLWEIAQELLGGYLTGNVTFIAAKKKWR